MLPQSAAKPMLRYADGLLQWNNGLPAAGRA
jgi:hypothetical protein